MGGMTRLLLTTLQAHTKPSHLGLLLVGPYALTRWTQLIQVPLILLLTTSCLVQHMGVAAQTAAPGRRPRRAPAAR